MRRKSVQRSSLAKEDSMYKKMKRRAYSNHPYLFTLAAAIVASLSIIVLLKFTLTLENDNPAPKPLTETEKYVDTLKDYWKEHGHVTESEYAESLNVKSFPEFLSRHDFTFVNFCIIRTPQCQRLAQIWKAFGQEVVKENFAFLGIGAVDCDNESDLCSHLDVNQFPTMRFFRHGEADPLDYRMDQTVSALWGYTKWKVKSLGFKHKHRPSIPANETLRKAEDAE